MAVNLEAVKVETLWVSDEARGQYERLEKTRAELAAAYGIDIWPREGLDIEASSATATELMSRQRRYWTTPDRAAKALVEFQCAADSINKLMLALYSRYTITKRTVQVIRDEAQRLNLD